MRRNARNILQPGRILCKERVDQNKINAFVKGKVCINRALGGIGDVLMATVALRELKRENPDIHLTFAIDQESTHDNTYYKLVKNAPFLDAIENSKYIRKERFDAYFDITSVCISEENSTHFPRGRIEIFSESIKVKNLKNKVPFYLEEQSEKEKFDLMFEKYKETKSFFIHTASNDSKRSYSKKNTVELVKLISNKYPDSVIFISDFNKIYSDWKSIDNVIDVSRLDIRETASIIKRCDLFVGPDSGLMHLSAAVKTKSLVIFGSIPPDSRIKNYDTHSSITLESLPCLGCWYKPCPYDIKCMRDLKAEVVFKKVRKMI